MLALLCGGQGRLSVEIFMLVAEQQAAAPVFNQARSILGEDPRALVLARDPDELANNRTSQLLTVTASLALYACIVDVLPDAVATTGYSVGEMAAWSIAGIWAAEEALRLTDIRARAMDAAGGLGGRLAYVRGLARDVLEKLANQHGCAVAIVNPGNLLVVGGAEPAVVALCDAAIAAGAVRADLLEVKIASHTPHLQQAVAPFQRALDASHLAPVRRGRILLAGGDGARIFMPAKATSRLAAQVATSIDWAQTLESLVELGVDRVLDLGPGHALADMMRAAFPQLASYAADGFHSLDGLRRWIASG